VRIKLAIDIKNGKISQETEFQKSSREIICNEKTIKEKIPRDELFKLIRFNFPRLEESEISKAGEQLAEFDRTKLELLLYPGNYMPRQGKRVQAAYIKTAPLISELVSEEGFQKWLLLADQTSKLSFSCLEGFFNSSTEIIKEKGLPVLEKWTEIGISIAKRNKQLAIAYFNHTADAVISTIASTKFDLTVISNDLDSRDLFINSNSSKDFSGDFEKFEALISTGERFASSNVKGAEVYFKHLPEMLSLLSPENFEFFCSIIECLLNTRWQKALELLAGAKDVFSTIPRQKQEAFLAFLDEYLIFGAAPVLAFFNNAPLAISKVNWKDFETWVLIARRIAEINPDAAVIFLNKSPDLLLALKTDELQKWSEIGISRLASEKQALEAFFGSSFKGFQRHLKTVNGEERLYLLNVGVELALLDPDCLDNYFEYSPPALKEFSDHNFKEWVDTGARILKENSNSGSNYFKMSVLAFRKIRASYHEEVFKIARILLEKDWLLAGKFFEALPNVVEKIEETDIRKWANTGIKVYETDRALSIAYFTYSPELLNELDITELEAWALNGLKLFEGNPFLGSPYFSLKSKSSNDFVEELTGWVLLKKVENILKYYAVGLSGTTFKIRSKKELPFYKEIDFMNPVISGRTIYLEPKLRKYGSFEENFKLYKLSIMHEVGHTHFSSLKIALEELNELRETAKNYNKADNQLFEAIQRTGDIIEISGNEIKLSDIIKIFPNRILAANIFGILEDARVEYLIMDRYKGIRAALENIRYQMLLERPLPEGELEKLMEALLWFSTLHEPVFEIKEEYRCLLDKMPEILQKFIFQPNSSTFNSLKATLGIYNLFENLLGSLEHQKYSGFKNIEYRGMDLDSFGIKDPFLRDSHENIIKRFIPENEDQRTERNEKNPSVEKESSEKKAKKEPKYAADKNWKVLRIYRYDEWDYAINDYKIDWCTVYEIEPAGKSNEYYKKAAEKYRNEIFLIKNVFSRMKPETFHKLKEQTDGTEIDIDTFSEALIEKKCGINPDEKFYVRWDKRKRDVATLFLVDISASTKKVLNPEGKRILDVERDALIIMIQALESIGDRYAIYAFSGNTEEDVEYYVIKNFEEEISQTVEQRISLLEPTANTRLGAALRHSIKKLEDIKAETKILILFSDGEPYDTCSSAGAYQGRLAEQDTKIAIQEGNAQGIHSFCITIDTDPGTYLDAIFSDSGYTIIDNAQSLPEKLPLLYKRITT
jgi:hypothetical protein